MKHIKEVYEEYKHLDHLLSDEDWMLVNNTAWMLIGNTALHFATYNMWQAIKKTVEEESDEKK